MPASRPVFLGLLVSFFLHGALVFFLWDIQGDSEARQPVAEARPPLVHVRLVEASPASPPPSRRPDANRILQEQEKGKRNKKAQVTNRTHFEDLPPVEPAPSLAEATPPVPQELAPSRAPVAPVAPASEPVLTKAASAEDDPVEPAEVVAAPPSSSAPVSETEIAPEPGESVPAAPSPAAPPPAAVMSDSEAPTAPTSKNKGSLLRSLDRILQEEKRAAAKSLSDDTDATGEAPVTDAIPQTEALSLSQEPVTNQATNQAAGLVDENAPLSTLETLRLKRQIGRCWNPPIGALEARQIKIRIDLDLREDATIERYQLIDVDGALDPDVKLAFEESARRAFHLPDCQKLDLPPGRFEAWRHLGLLFSVAELLGYAPS